MKIEIVEYDKPIEPYRTHSCPTCGDVHLPPQPNEVKPTEPQS